MLQVCVVIHSVVYFLVSKSPYWSLYFASLRWMWTQQ